MPDIPEIKVKMEVNIDGKIFRKGFKLLPGYKDKDVRKMFSHMAEVGFRGWKFMTGKND